MYNRIPSLSLPLPFLFFPPPSLLFPLLPLPSPSVSPPLSPSPALLSFEDQLRGVGHPLNYKKRPYIEIHRNVEHTIRDPYLLLPRGIPGAARRVKMQKKLDLFGRPQNA